LDNIRVMAVDDEMDILKIVKISFELAGCSVIECTSGEECLEKLKSNERPDVILLDVMMPGLSGHETCKKIKADKNLRGIRVIMLTAKGQRADADEGLESGADDYIIKPFDPYELVEQVKEIMAR